MDPRFATVAPSSVGIDLRCENCKTIIHQSMCENEGISLFELVRETLRHNCEE